MKFSIILLLTFCLLGVKNTLAKPKFNVEILVRDNYTGEPISNVEILVKQKGELLLTDVSGRIYLKEISEERLTIEISHAAYRHEIRHEYFKARQRKDCSFNYRLQPGRELLNQHLKPIIDKEIAKLQSIDSAQYLPCDQDSTPERLNAQFPGGMKMFRHYISSNLIYPEESIDMEEQGKVYLSFIIEKDGSISNIKVERGVSTPLDREAKRLIQEMPDWIPSYCNGRPEATRLRIPLIFKLN
ncbi:MAG: hypothetical protein Crog4KO_21210 [Crocinitomicaceae bacterium]